MSLLSSPWSLENPSTFLQLFGDLSTSRRVREEKCLARRAQIKFWRKNVFVSQFIIDQIYIKIPLDFPAAAFPHFTPSSSSILMCTWIWQCHVNLIKLNEWRRGRDEKQKQAEKTFLLKLSIKPELNGEALETKENRMIATEKDEMEIN